MDAATAGLLGAVIGAVAGVGGSLITHGLQARLARENWLRDKRVETYTNAVRYLIRVSNKRSSITASGQTVLGKDAIKEWFDDISEVRSWMTSLVIYCSVGERPMIEQVTRSFNDAATEFISSGNLAGGLIAAAQKACAQVADSARKDIGADATFHNDDLPF
jgi:hypothetical protein